MALRKSKSRRCPVCLVHTPAKVDEVNAELAGILADVKDTGEIPKPVDHRFKAISDVIGIAPHSLHTHLRSCLVDLEIQDQRFQELKDLTELIATAKDFYATNPGKGSAEAVTSMLTQWRGLADDIEGQTDPSQTVEFLVETVLSPMNRKVLGSAAQELRELRESLVTLLPKNQHPFITTKINSVLSRVSAALRESTDDGLKAICSYYKVELEVQSKKRALDSTANTSPIRMLSTNDDDEEMVH